MGKQKTTEQAVLALLDNPGGADIAASAYYSRDPVSAADRFAGSEEWASTRDLLHRHRVPVGDALDLGAGNGIASIALARLGYRVTAVEPDPSDVVGSGAIRRAALARQVDVALQSAFGEALPSATGSFDLVYARQVLHHAANLRGMIREVARVLRPGGWFLAIREHVIDDEASREAFLANHPLHPVTGSENAYRLEEYTSAIAEHMQLRRVLGPWDSVINHYPDRTAGQFRRQHAQHLNSRFGPVGSALAHIPGLLGRYGRLLSAQDRTPGRRFSFLAQKS